MFLLSSINARGLGPRKRDFVKDYIRKSSVDICCVQEIKDFLKSDRYLAGAKLPPSLSSLYS